LDICGAPLVLLAEVFKAIFHLFSDSDAFIANPYVMSSSTISANTLDFLKEVREERLAKCASIHAPNIATSEGPSQPRDAAQDGQNDATAVGEASPGTQGGAEMEVLKTQVIPEEEFHTILRPPYHSTWQEGPDTDTTISIDGGFEINASDGSSPFIAAAGINAIYTPPVDGYPIGFSISATFDFDWASGSVSPGESEGAIQFTIAENGTNRDVLSGGPVLWQATSGQGQGTNVQYTSPIYGSFVGQAGTEYVINVGFYVVVEGNAWGTITGTITDLSLYTHSPEKLGN
jgi:hypothetical protein